jgi:hypothetical protein
MSPWRWIQHWLRPCSPEEKARVEIDDASIRCVHPEGRVDTLAWSDLRLVAVETNDAGPFLEDVYFYLEGPEYGFYIPQAAAGTDELLQCLTKLPGFDNAAFGAAMCSTANARFVCWTRSRV